MININVEFIWTPVMMELILRTHCCTVRCFPSGSRRPSPHALGNAAGRRSWRPRTGHRAETTSSSHVRPRRLYSAAHRGQEMRPAVSHSSEHQRDLKMNLTGGIKRRFIIYSTSNLFQTCMSFFCWTHKMMFWRMLVTKQLTCVLCFFFTMRVNATGNCLFLIFFCVKLTQVTWGWVNDERIFMFG